MLNNNKLKDILTKIILVMCSIIFSFFCFEITLRFVHIKTECGIPRYYYTFDNFTGNDLAKNYPPVFHEVSYFKYKIWSNEISCFDKPYKGEKDYILLLGDSFAWGCAPFEYKYGTLVEQYLNFRVLKCGVAGYGTKQELFKLEKTINAVKNKPKLIIVSYYLGNDFFEDYLFPNRTVVDGYLVNKTVLKDIRTGEKEVYSDRALREQVKNYKIYNSRKPPLGIMGKTKRWLLVHSALYQLIRDNAAFRKIAAKFKLLDTPPPETPPPVPYISAKQFRWLEGAWKEHLLNLKEIKAVSDKYGARLLVVEIPQKEQVYDFLQNNKDIFILDWEQPNKILKFFFDKEGIDYLDLTPYFRSYANQNPRKYLDSEKDLYWQFDTHFNIKGNELTGLLIALHILNNKLIDTPGLNEKKTAAERKLIEFNVNN